MLRALLPFILCGFGLTTVQAQIIIENPTPMDILVNDITQVFQASANLAKAVGEMNADFAETRRQLADTEPGSDAHRQALRKLEQLELSKNIGFLSLYLFEGATENSRKNLMMPEVFGGAKVDGGIPEAALPAFEDWVRKVRAPLGVTDGQVLVLLDSPDTRAHFMKALVDSQDVYQHYLRRADQARADEVTARATAAAEEARLAELYQAAKLPSGGVRLYDSSTEALKDSMGIYLQPPMGDLRKALFSAAEQGQQVLHCRYGPLPGADNKPVYRRNVFWHQHPPATIDAMLKMDTNGALRNFGTQSFQACPDDSMVAEAARKTAFTSHPLAITKPATSSPSSPQRGRNATDTAYCERQAKHLEESRGRVNSMPPGFARSLARLEASYKARCQ